MNTPDQNDISKFINDENTKPIRIIFLDFAAGVTLFAIVCFVFYFRGLNEAGEIVGEDDIQFILG